MNQHEKKVARLMSEKNNAEADMANYRIAYFNDKTASEKRIDAAAIFSCQKRLNKIYKEIDNSLSFAERVAWACENESRYTQSETSWFVIGNAGRVAA